jgi:hypothetical protein
MNDDASKMAKRLIPCTRIPLHPPHRCTPTTAPVPCGDPGTLPTSVEVPGPLRRSTAAPALPPVAAPPDVQARPGAHGLARPAESDDVWASKPVHASRLERLAHADDAS